MAAIVAAERADLTAAAVVLDEAGQTTEADACRDRAAILERYLAA